MIDNDLLPALSTISIVSLPPSAIGPLIQLVSRRKINTETSDISCVEVQAFEHGLPPNITQELKALEETVCGQDPFDKVVLEYSYRVVRENISSEWIFQLGVPHFF